MKKFYVTISIDYVEAESEQDLRDAIAEALSVIEPRHVDIAIDEDKSK